MRARRDLLMATVLGFFAIVTPAGAQTGGTEPTLAVLDFVVDRNGGLALPRSFGASAADLLVNQLVESGRFRVLDRLWLQGRGMPATDRDPLLESIRIAAIAEDVDYLVLGSINRYSTVDRNRTYGGAVFRIPLLGGVHRNRTESMIALTVRVIDVRTGQIVAGATPEGTASHKKLSLAAFGVFGGGGGGDGPNGAVAMRDALVNSALQQAVVGAGRALVSAAPRLTRGPRNSTEPRNNTDERGTPDQVRAAAANRTACDR